MRKQQAFLRGKVHLMTLLVNTTISILNVTWGLSEYSSRWEMEELMQSAETNPHMPLDPKYIFLRNTKKLSLLGTQSDILNSVI